MDGFENQAEAYDEANCIAGQYNSTSAPVPTCVCCCLVCRSGQHHLCPNGFHAYMASKPKDVGAQQV